MMKLFKRIIPSRRKNHTTQSGLVNEQVADISKESFVSFLLGRGQFTLAAHVINQYWATCAPLSDAVDKLSSASASVQPSIWDESENSFENDHPLITLLKQPNMLQTYEKFFKRLAGLYILHGEVYLISTGRVNKEPLELFVTSSQSVNIDTNSNDGFIETMTLQDGLSQTRFFRHEEQGRFRYYDVPVSVGANNALREMIQIANFNPTGSLIPEHGRSVLQSLYFEIEQWLAASKHNLSVLLRGGTLSGVFSTDANFGALTKDQRAMLGEQLDNYVSGAENAGRVALFDNGIKFDSTTQTNKDMDFRDLKKDIKVDIYNRLEIPSPLVNETTMTMANRASAQIEFYTNAVLPLTKLLYDQITLFVMYRYPDSEDKSLRVDTSNVPALEPLKIDKITKLISFKILTINETRELIDYDPLLNGGNTIYSPSATIPIASNEDLPSPTDNQSTDIESEPDEDNDDDDEKMMTRDEFTKLMRAQTDSKGKRKFNDDRINEIADRENLK